MNEPTEEQKLAALIEVSKDDLVLRTRLAERMVGKEKTQEAPATPPPPKLSPVDMMVLVAGADAKWAQHSDGTRQGWPGMAASIEIPAEPHPWQDRSLDEIMSSRNAAAIAMYLAKNPNAVAEHCTARNLSGKGK